MKNLPGGHGLHGGIVISLQLGGGRPGLPCRPGVPGRPGFPGVPAGPAGPCGPGKQHPEQLPPLLEPGAAALELDC